MMRELPRVLPTTMKLNRPLAWRRLNSTIEPNPGSGDALPRLTAIVADSFVTAFNERSTSAAFVKCSNIKDRPLEPTYAVLCSVYVSSGFKERSTSLLMIVDWLEGVHLNGKRFVAP